MVRIVFPVVRVRREVAVKCACGKNLKRVVKVEHTINPFNKNELGFMKTESEVRASANSELDRRVTETLDRSHACKSCRDQGA